MDNGKIFTLIGAALGIIAAAWVLIGNFEFWKGRRNDDHIGQSRGLEGIIAGIVTAIVTGSVVAYIVAQLKTLF